MSRSDFADIGVYAHTCACHDKAAQRYFSSINDAASICNYVVINPFYLFFCTDDLC